MKRVGLESDMNTVVDMSTWQYRGIVVGKNEELTVMWSSKESCS